MNALEHDVNEAIWRARGERRSEESGMNRREAIAALVSLPAVTSIAVAQLQPTDVIVIEVAGVLDRAGIATITRQMELVWPGRKVLVLEQGLTLKIVRT